MLMKRDYFDTKQLSVQQTKDLMFNYIKTHKVERIHTSFINKNLERIRIKSLNELPVSWLNDLNEFIRLYKSNFAGNWEFYVVGGVANGKSIIPNVTSASDVAFLQTIRRPNKLSDIDVFVQNGQGVKGAKFSYQGASVKVEVPATSSLRKPYLKVIHK